MCPPSPVMRCGGHRIALDRHKGAANKPYCCLGRLLQVNSAARLPDTIQIVRKTSANKSYNPNSALFAKAYRVASGSRKVMHGYSSGTRGPSFCIAEEPRQTRFSTFRFPADLLPEPVDMVSHEADGNAKGMAETGCGVPVKPTANAP